MKKILIALASAGFLLSIAAPASSQDATVRVRTGDGPGVAVSVGDRNEVRRDQHHRARGHHAYGRDDCRTVIIKKRLPDGTRVTRRINRC